MNKLSVLLLSGVVLAFAGCDNKGSSTDPYNTESGTISNANYNRRSVTNEYRGSARTPGRTDAGVISSTNYPSLGTNYPSQPFDPARTVPKN